MSKKVTNRIKHFRETANLSQADLARLCGFSEPRMCNYELSRRTPDLDDSREIVWQLNKFVDCTLDDVFPPKRKGKPVKIVELALQAAKAEQEKTDSEEE